MGSTFGVVAVLAALAALYVKVERISMGLERLKSAIVKEIQDAVLAAGVELGEKLAALTADRDAALALAATEQERADAEAAARQSLQEALGAYQAQVEQLASDIEAPGVFGSEPDVEPEPQDPEVEPEPVDPEVEPEDPEEPEEPADPEPEPENIEN